MKEKSAARKAPNPELTAIRRIISAFEDLGSNGARRRVLKYVSALDIYGLEHAEDAPPVPLE